MYKCKCYRTKTDKFYTYHQITSQPVAHYIEVGVCDGTAECEKCSCGGNKEKCDFYPSVRNQKYDDKDQVSGEPLGYIELIDWWLRTVDPSEETVLTNAALKNLFDNFYLIPKEK